MTAATDVIATALVQGKHQVGSFEYDQAKRVLAALENSGFEVMAPQDIAWGECPGNWDDSLAETDPHPHEVSLELCKWCLEYGPE